MQRARQSAVVCSHCIEITNSKVEPTLLEWALHHSGEWTASLPHRAVGEGKDLECSAQCNAPDNRPLSVRIALRLRIQKSNPRFLNGHFIIAANGLLRCLTVQLEKGGILNVALNATRQTIGNDCLISSGGGWSFRDATSLYAIPHTHATDFGS